MTAKAKRKPASRTPAKVGRKSKLTPDVAAKIIGYVRAGAFDWVAAQAAGIHPATFYRYMNEAESPGEPYSDFREKVAIARAEARVVAESEVKKADPFQWLRYGPGRERPGQPGWTDGRSGLGAPPVVIGIDARRGIELPDNLIRYLEGKANADADDETVDGDGRFSVMRD